MLQLLVSGALCDMGKDNKATESNPAGSLVEPPMDKEKKVTEKRAPIHLTAVPGMSNLQQPYTYKYFLDSSLSSASKAPLVLKTTPAPASMYQSYVSMPQNLHGGFNYSPMLVLMATQHPSGYTMLIPATLIPHPMSMFNYMYVPQYTPTPSPVYSQPLPTKSYSPIPKSPNFGQLSANAGFAAQHQLLYSGPGYESTATGSDGSSLPQAKASPEPFSNRLRGLEPYIKG